MSLKHFPGLCSSTDSPIHLCGFYNNVLLLFCVNICYCAGSAFFLPPTFLLLCALPEKCGLTETIPRDIAIYSSVTGHNLSGNVHRAGGEAACGRTTTRTRRVSAAHPQPAHSPVRRGLCHISGQGCCTAGGFWAGAWVHNF